MKHPTDFYLGTKKRDPEVGYKRWYQTRNRISEEDLLRIYPVYINLSIDNNYWWIDETGDRLDDAGIEHIYAYRGNKSFIFFKDESDRIKFYLVVEYFEPNPR